MSGLFNCNLNSNLANDFEVCILEWRAIYGGYIYNSDFERLVARTGENTWYHDESKYIKLHFNGQSTYIEAKVNLKVFKSNTFEVFTVNANETIANIQSVVREHAAFIVYPI